MSLLPKRRFFAAAPVVVTILLVGSPSIGQEATVTTSPAVVVQPAAAQPAVVVEKKDKEEKDFAHFRFGLGLDGNFLLSPGTEGLQGLGIGIQVRLGVQINQWMAAYYQAHGVLGGTLANSGDLEPAAGSGTSTGIIGLLFNSAIFEATLPVLHVGAGPSVDVIGVKGLVADSTQACFGLEGRAAIVIGGHGPGRHGGFAINFNVHPTFWESTVLTTFSAGIGGEMY